MEYKRGDEIILFDHISKYEDGDIVKFDDECEFEKYRNFLEIKDKRLIEVDEETVFDFTDPEYPLKWEKIGELEYKCILSHVRQKAEEREDVKRVKWKMYEKIGCVFDFTGGKAFENIDLSKLKERNENE